jgi:hypothetical protein
MVLGQAQPPDTTFHTFPVKMGMEVEPVPFSKKF